MDKKIVSTGIGILIGITLLLALAQAWPLVIIGLGIYLITRDT